MISLDQISTRAPEGLKKEEVKSKLDKLYRQIGDLQRIMYAQGKHNILAVFQGMDASGKDGVTRRAFRYCTHVGLDAYSFKKPTEEEFDHDFLWRVHKVAPRKGHIQVYIRSHYEDILIQRVHKWIDEDHVKMRMDAINAYERLLQEDNGTLILKFYMHLSRERQQEKLQERIDDPRKQWKHNAQDWEEAKLWDEYRKCYEYAINNSEIPWIIVPSDQRWYRNYFASQEVLKALQSLPLELPSLESDG